MAVALGILLLALVGCGSDPASVPNVVGYRLDDAHNMLKDAGFKNFNDVDAIEDRTPMMDANWVVLAQDPAAGSDAETDTTIRLDIAKPEDDGVRERLPAGSPVAEELRLQDEGNARAEAEEQAREAEERRQEEADQAEGRQEFVDTVDPTARVAQNAIAELAQLEDRIASEGAVSISTAASLTDIKRALDLYWDAFEDAPDHINEHADELQEAIKQFVRADDTLISAEGMAAAGSLDRFRQLYEEARTRYNSAMTEIYKGTTVPPPLV